jgi:hypothetical protein
MSKLKDVIDELVTANRIKGEADAVIARTGPYTLDRAWEAFARRVGWKIREPR